MPLSKYTRSSVYKSVPPSVKLYCVFSDITFMNIWMAQFIQTDELDKRVIAVFKQLTGKTNKYFFVSKNKFISLFLEFYHNNSAPVPFDKIVAGV